MTQPRTERSGVTPTGSGIGSLLNRYPSLPYVVPFAAFMLSLAIQQQLKLPATVDVPLKVVLSAVTLWIFSRHVIDFRVRQAAGTIAIGVAVFALWILPDVLIPGYRDHWLFQNSITGKIDSSIEPAARTPFILFLRTVRAVLLVPILEELFWRAWMMRWLIKPRFFEVPLGTYSRDAFWIVAILFASEHGPFWDVGLAAGIIYNWWMIRTKSLGDLILAHAITNALLCAYVLMFGHWEYWL